MPPVICPQQTGVSGFIPFPFDVPEPAAAKIGLSPVMQVRTDRRLSLSVQLGTGDGPS